MSSLRTDVVEELKAGGWAYVARYGATMRGVHMRHELMRSGDRLQFVVVTEAACAMLHLNQATWLAAMEERAELGLPMDVLLCQAPFQLMVSSDELAAFLKQRTLMERGKPNAYWPLTVGIR